LADEQGHIYVRNPRGAVEKIELTVRDALERLSMLGNGGGIFDICGLSRKVTKKMHDFCHGDCDVYEDGAVISVGQTLTKYHVEDLALANVQTLQRVHTSEGEAAFKVWFIACNPSRGLKLKRANEHSVSPRLVRDAEFIVIQREGDTIYLPPLAYHAVVTAYSTNVSPSMRYTLLSGDLFR
jgi:hypothetical protein